MVSRTDPAVLLSANIRLTTALSAARCPAGGPAPAGVLVAVELHPAVDVGDGVARRSPRRTAAPSGRRRPSSRTIPGCRGCAFSATMAPVSHPAIRLAIDQVAAGSQQVARRRSTAGRRRLRVEHVQRAEAATGRPAVSSYRSMRVDVTMAGPGWSSSRSAMMPDLPVRCGARTSMLIFHPSHAPAASTEPGRAGPRSR